MAPLSTVANCVAGMGAALIVSLTLVWPQPLKAYTYE